MHGRSERRLAAIAWNLKHAARLEWEEPPAPNAFPPEVLELLAQGNKLQAMRALMSRLGITLADAKEMIDRGHL